MVVTHRPYQVIQPLSPKHHIVGSIEIKQNRVVDEGSSQGKSLSRKYLIVTYSKYGNKGRNSRSCKGHGRPSEKVWRVKERKIM
uniref:Uncharacterized protein n=1 Tax=Lactuca sativa TaxID=4236 RepID=A0A9R1WNV5_LACSA|nr:hypothetical protein LSAT_V11C100047260 [Lactuca sativa]